MRQIPVLILKAAGTNCDAETAFAFEQCGGRCDIVHVNRFVGGPQMVHSYSVVVIPGGFSYGDDLSAGKVFALELNRSAAELATFVDRGGLMLGICNGFQVLVKMGLLPGTGLSASRQEVTLTDNDSDHYEDRWVRLQVRTTRSPFFTEADAFELPVAHGEGKLVALDPALDQALV